MSAGFAKFGVVAWRGRALFGAGNDEDGGGGEDDGHGRQQDLVAGDGDEGCAQGDGEGLRGGDQDLGGREDAALELWRGEALGERHESDDQQGDGGTEENGAGDDRGQQGEDHERDARGGDEHGQAGQSPLAGPADQRGGGAPAGDRAYPLHGAGDPDEGGRAVQPAGDDGIEAGLGEAEHRGHARTRDDDLPELGDLPDVPHPGGHLAGPVALGRVRRGLADAQQQQGSDRESEGRSVDNAMACGPTATNRAAPVSGPMSRSPSCAVRSAAFASGRSSAGTMTVSRADWAGPMTWPDTP